MNKKYTHEDGTPFTKEEFIEKLKSDKEFNKEFGKKHVQPGKMALRPCHAFFQLYSEEIPNLDRNKLFEEWALENRANTSGMSVESAMEHYDFPKRYVSLQLYQRSADVFLGVPFNIAGYSLLLHMIGQVVNMVPKKFVHTFGDAHIYSNHELQIKELLSRVDYSKEYYGPKLPKIKIAKKDSIFDYKFEDIELVDYKSLGLIKAPVAI